MSKQHSGNLSRRDVLVRTGQVAAASALAGIEIPHVHAAGNELIKVALVGCGGRGTGAAVNALATAGGPTRLVAMADVFQDKLTNSYNTLNQGGRVMQIDVPQDRRFVGFDAYRRAMDSLREGDVVILHTGWGDLFLQHPAKNTEYNSGEAGLGKAAAKSLIDQKIVAVGSDTWAVEVIPGESQDEAFIVHQMLLTDSGIHIIENVRTDLMAAEVATSNRGTFFFSMTVPKAVGLTGTFVAIDAIH